MDISYWDTLHDNVDNIRFYFLAFDLIVLIPLSVWEIVFVQRFKVDRLFLFTCMLYATCFTFRIINLKYF